MKTQPKITENKPIVNHDFDTIDDVLQDSASKNSKKYGFSVRTIKHLQTLRKYYEIDFEKRVIIVPLHFKHATDIIEEGVGSEKHPIIQRSLLSKISSIAHSIPYEFKIDVDLRIDNYDGYEHSEIAKSLLDAFEMFQFDLSKSRVKSNLKLFVLVALGILIFAWLFYLCSKHWFGEPGDPTHDTIHELIYTVASVFIWEAVYIAFLNDNSYDGISGWLLARINEIKLYNSKKTLLTRLTNPDIKQSWNVESKAKKTARTILFVAGTAIFCIASCKVIDVVEIFIKYATQPIPVASAIITLITAIFAMLGGLGALSYYRDKGPFRKILFLFSVFELALSIADVSIAIVMVTHDTQAIKTLVLGCICLIMSIMFIVSICILKKNDKKQPLRNK